MATPQPIKFTSIRNKPDRWNRMAWSLKLNLSSDDVHKRKPQFWAVSFIMHHSNRINRSAISLHRQVQWTSFVLFPKCDLEIVKRERERMRKKGVSIVFVISGHKATLQRCTQKKDFFFLMNSIEEMKNLNPRHCRSSNFFFLLIFHPNLNFRDRRKFFSFWKRF